MRPRQRFKIVLRLLIGAFLLGGIFLIAAFAYFSRGLPDPDQIADRSVAQSTRIYARDGTTLLYEVHGNERRTVIELADIPDTARQATIAIEDRDFYRHGGFKLTSIARAVLANVTQGSKVQGGSTITQQLIKNTILTKEKTYTRKLKELVLAYQMERKFSKDQILKLYFNQIPYGANAYGIEAAAETFFGKSAKTLTLPESALLAALPQAPSYYSPYGSHPDALLNRYRLVLERMVDEQYISREQADDAQAVDILSSIKPRREAILAAHFVFYVKELLAERYPESVVERGGLKVVTTLDMDRQRIAEEEIQKGVATNEKKYRANNASLVSLDVKTGQVLAMVGSRDYFDDAHDGQVNVALRERNPGSSFKPFVYASAFSRGYTPETVLFDLKTNFGPDGSGKPYQPLDYDGKERGPVTMRQALAGSLNIPAVKTLYLAGINRTVDLARALGYTTYQNPDKYGLALALGGAGVKLLEHTAAFGTLAREGQRLPTTAILRVEDAKGKVLEEAKTSSGDRVIDKNVARLVQNIMSDNKSRAFIFGSNSPLVLKDRPVAAKTGTTNDWRDGWTVGFTPSIVTGVWAGNNDNSPMARGADGVFVAAPIWNGYMNRVHEHTRRETFEAPKKNEAKKPILKGEFGQEDISVDKITRKRIPDDCLKDWPKDFVDTVRVKQYHSILHYVDRENPTGDPPKNPKKDPMFERWEKPILAWASKKGQGDLPAFESCDLRTEQHVPVVSFTQPTEGATVSGAAIQAAVSVQSDRAIVKVEFLLDEQVGATVTAPPFAAALNFTEAIAPGFHTLTARATDDIGNVGATSLTVNVGGGGSATLYFVSPDPGSHVPQGIPIVVSGHAASPAGVASVTLSEIQDQGEVALSTTQPAPDGSVSFTLPSLASGLHVLTLTLKGNNGQSLTTDGLILTVDP